MNDKCWKWMSNSTKYVELRKAINKKCKSKNVYIQNWKISFTFIKKVMDNKQEIEKYIYVHYIRH